MKQRFKNFIIRLAASYVRAPVEQYYDEIDWTDEDAKALDEHLKSEEGKRFMKMLGQKSLKVLNGLLTEDKDIVAIRAEAQAWRSVVTMLQMLRVAKRDLKKQDVAKLDLETIFGRIVNNSSRINTSAIYGKAKR